MTAAESGNAPNVMRRGSGAAALDAKIPTTEVTRQWRKAERFAAGGTD